MFKLTIKGNPVSVNALYVGRRYISDRGQSIKEDYYYQIKGQWKSKPLAKRLNLTLEAYFGSERRFDIDNVCKVVLDALNGIVWVDDNLVDELHVFRKFDKENPRVEIIIKEL